MTQAMMTEPEAASTQPYIEPIEHPKGLLNKIIFFFMRRMFGKVMTPMAVMNARMPLGFLRFYLKVSKLDKKLVLPKSTVFILRERISALNQCFFCQDATRFYVMTKAPQDLARVDAVPEYRTSTLFTDAERAALDYVSEITETHHAQTETIAHLKQHYSDREICDMAWIISSEHLYNLSNKALNIGSDGFCEMRLNRVKG